MTAVAGTEPVSRPLVAQAIDIVIRFSPQVLLVLMLGIIGVVEPAALGPANLLNSLVNAVPIAVLALGAMWILVSGGLDLSAGYGVAMCALVVAGQLQAGHSALWAFAAGLIAGMALGLVNGLLVGPLSMPPFIATLATMAAVQGAVLKLGAIGTYIVSDDTIAYIGVGSVAGVPLLLIIAVVIAAAVWLIARFTRFGLRTYAIGSDKAASTARGVPVVRQTVLVYVFGGLLVGLTGLILVAKVQIVDTNIASTSLLLDAFAATILGGTSLFGGRGTVAGTLTGAFLIATISTSLVVSGVGAQSIDLFRGAIIVLAVVIDAGIQFLRKARDRVISKREQ